MNRIPPHNLSAETELLGTVLTFPESIKLLSLSPEHFYRTAYQNIYRAMLKVKDITLNTITEELKKRNELEDIDLIDIMDHGLSDTTNEPNERIIKEKYRLRKLLECASRIVTMVHANEECNDIVNTATDELIQLSEVDTVGDSIADYLHAFNDEVDRRRSGEIVDISAPLIENTAAGETCVFAARPSVGKTSLATQILFQCGVSCGMITLESTGKKIVGRMLSQVSGVDFTDLRFGRIEKYDLNKVIKASNDLANAPIKINETSDKAAEILATAHKWKIKHNIQLLVIDYLQLIDGGIAETKNIEVGKIMRQLVRFGKRNNVAMIIVSQLSRAGNDRPGLHHLRDSGSIEQDADKVVLLHRPNDDVRNKIECIIAKNRNGAIGTSILNYNPPTMTFSAEV